MSVELIYRSKLTLVHPMTKMIVICELKIWKLIQSIQYPDGIKYSLFCVEKASGNIVIGYDNHHPKGHHVHFDETEFSYLFVDHERLIEDFWASVQKRGFSL